jgi:uncharacterized protein YbjT (DUF2867 family)
MDPILIYGANGYTGALIAEEAVRRGLKPILAGRNRDALDALAQRLQLTRRVFGLADPAGIARGLDGIDLLLNCAGPFSHTAAALLEACLEQRFTISISPARSMCSRSAIARSRARGSRASSSRPVSVSMWCRPIAPQPC